MPFISMHSRMKRAMIPTKLLGKHTKNAVKKQLFLITLMLTTISSSHFANAQNAGRWYEVEMIFFNQGLGRIDRQELWPEHIKLNYPDAVKVLTDPPENPTTDELDTAANSLNGSLATEEEALEVEVEGIPRETPFQRLSDDHKHLTDLVKKIKTSGRHRILAHWVWQQPVMGRNNADSIAIFGGRQFDDHYELEGSIDLSVGRFLHLATNLWITRFTPIPDYQEIFNPWPQLPLLPSLAAKDALFESPAGIVKDDEDLTNINHTDDLESPTTEALIEEVIALNESNIESENTSIEGKNTAVKKPRNYQPKRIALIKEKRKMRSATLHFIDHPLMGILIEIRRVNNE